MAVRIEDAGFEIRDMIAWVYGSGFPKSLNIGKAVDKLQGNEREIIETNETIPDIRANNYSNSNGKERLTANITKGTSEWEGWGTALKPSMEPITVARKPLSEKTVAENVLKWGTGGINIDACRVEINPEIDDMLRETTRQQRQSETWENGSGFKNEKNSLTGVPENGRFPANLIHDGSEEVMKLFPQSKGQQGDLKGHNKERQSPNGCYGKMAPAYDYLARNDSGSAARFFYCAKASKAERNAGLENFEPKERVDYGGFHSEQGLINNGRNPDRRLKTTNNHPTVKPIKLIKYLIQLVTKPGGLTYDPFGGSGTLKLAAQDLGINWIISEMEEEYCKIAENRNLKSENNTIENQLKLF
jgi:site-specific DNA-methyltransferase (adenine-specific)